MEQEKPEKPDEPASSSTTLRDSTRKTRTRYSPGMILDRFKVDGQVAVITGAGRGIGAGDAVALAEAGADVVISARHAKQLAEVADAGRGRRPPRAGRAGRPVRPRAAAAASPGRRTTSSAGSTSW